MRPPTLLTSRETTGPQELMPELVFSDSNEPPQTAGPKQQTFKSHSAGLWESKIKVPANSVPGPALQGAAFSPCPRWEERELGSLSLLLGAQIPWLGPHPHDLT